MKKYIYTGLTGALLMAFLMSGIAIRQKREKVRLRLVVTALTTDLAIERTRNDEVMVKIGALELSNGEMKDNFSGVVDELKNMNVKLRKMTGYSSTATETKYEFHTAFRDTVIRDTVKIEKLEYKTEWVDLAVIKQGLDAEVSLVTRDSLIQVVYWERPRKLLFIKFGRKVYSQKIRSANPDARIVYAEFIIPRKR